MPAEYADDLLKGTGKLSGGPEAFITAADDLAGINTIEGAAKRLTLLEPSGALRLDGNAIVEFRLKSVKGIRSPYNRTYPGFINGGLTGGGAREWIVDSGVQIYDVTVRYLR
ncbi:hypothetical protein KHQ81_00590 [Mycoplasmatota bacterium]|nr:hypothetical protein KHQ81_00590 [Mycoplasmatota bacterium]